MKYLYCSGTLIAPAVFVTAAHCIAAAAYYGADPHPVTVTFDPVYDDSATLQQGAYHLTVPGQKRLMTRDWPVSDLAFD